MACLLVSCIRRQLTGIVTPVAPGGVITVPTDGKSLIRITGTNLGVAPAIFMGRDFIAVGATAVTPCPPPQSDPNTCIQVVTPQGEGTGRQIADARFVNGYFLRIDASAALPGATGVDSTLQSSPTYPFAYAPPVVTSVTSGSPLGFPTRGGVVLTLQGLNFGYTLPTDVMTVTVAFGLTSDGGGFLTCTPRTRVSHYVITCTLAVGSGAALAARVVVADQTAISPAVLSYNRPNISAVISYGVNGSVTGNSDPRPSWSNFPILRGPTSGTTLIGLVGTDFGTRGALNCVFLAWSGRNPSAVPTCNGVEDFLGEGEVPFATNIAPYTWTHESITFRVIPGVGFRDIVLSLRGNTLNVTGPSDRRQPRFRYDAPVIKSMTIVAGGISGGSSADGAPLLLDTAGWQLVKVTGANFGPSPFDTTAFPPNTLTYNFNQTAHGPFNLSVAPSLPTAYMAVELSLGCVSSARSINGGAPLRTSLVMPSGSLLPLSRCVDGIINQTDTSFEFYTSPGVGI